MILPIALGAVAVLALMEWQKKREGAPPALPPIPLQPGAEPYLPPVAAPDPIRNLIANALYSQNATAIETAARNLSQLGYGELALPLYTRATQLRQQSAAAGWTLPVEALSGRIASPYAVLRRRALRAKVSRLARTA